MVRFQQKKQPHYSRKFLVSAVVFLLITGVFYSGIQSLSSGTRKRQREALENALNRGITYCYSVEGFYPADLEYLEKNYGLVYDKNLFFVDYQVSGSNIYPDVTILEKGE